MVMATAALSADQKQAFGAQGYVVVPGLFGQDDVRALLDTFMSMHAGGPIPGCFTPKRRLGADADPGTQHDDQGLAPISRLPSGTDILDYYPRMMHPHHVNDLALRYLLDRRLRAILTFEGSELEIAENLDGGLCGTDAAGPH